MQTDPRHINSTTTLPPRHSTGSAAPSSPTTIRLDCLPVLLPAPSAQGGWGGIAVSILIGSQHPAAAAAAALAAVSDNGSPLHRHKMVSASFSTRRMLRTESVTSLTNEQLCSFFFQARGASWGFERQPIKIEREGRGSGHWWPPFYETMQQSNKCWHPGLFKYW